MEGFTLELIEDSEEIDDAEYQRLLMQFGMPLPKQLELSLDDLRFWCLCADARDLAENPFSQTIILEGIRDTINAKPRDYLEEVCLDFVESLGMTPEEIIEKSRVEAGDAVSGAP